jgi:DNA-binding transcriptional LysR family regulator
VALKVSNRDRIIERISSNEDDLYVMGQTPDDLFDLETFPFAPNPLVVMAPRSHPLVGKKNIPLSRIADEPFILREPGSGIRDATLKVFDKLGRRPPVRMELGSNEAIKHAIVGGLGLSVQSLHTLTLEGPDGPVAILDVEGFPIMRQWYLVYPVGKELSLVAQAFLDFALEIEPRMRDRLQTMWPKLSKVLKTSKQTAAAARRVRKA